jgi:uncharacterized protein
MSESRTVPAIILGTALIAAATIGAIAVTGLKRAGDDITVTGSATRPVRADLAVWRLDVTAQAPSQLDATRRAAEGAEAVRRWLTGQGFPDSAITVRAPSTYVQNEWINGMETGRIIGYRVGQQVELRTASVDRVAELAGDLTPLLDQGTPVVGQAPEFLYAALPELRGPLLADATKDARVRAEEIVTAAGAKVGRIKAVRVGVFQVRRRQSTEISDYGMYDTSDRDKDVTGVVRVTFALD